MYSAAYTWAKVLARLEQQLTEVTVSTWLDDAEVIELTAERLIIYTPSDYRQEIIRSRCAEHIESALEELLHCPVRLEVWGETELKGFREKKRSTDTVSLNAQFSFDSFVAGSSNHMAKSITEEVSKNPGKSPYNPLLLYGDPGVGKTHLLYAAANRLIETKPELKVVCMKTEAFINEFISAIRNDNTAAFKNKLRQADVLLLDDIQVIAGKETTQEEFCSIFNTLYENGRQIILTSDRRPSDMPALNTRLNDRFGGGIMVEVNLPDLEARLQIVRLKAAQYGIPLEKDIMESIAQDTQNVRQVEGVLKKLRAFREFSGITVDSAAVDSVLSELVSGYRPKRASADMILQQVCHYYHVTEQALRGSNRSKTFAEPRQIAMFLMYTMGEMRYDAIAKEFSRDRATVIHSIKKMDSLYSQEETIRQCINNIRKAIEEMLA